MKVGERDGRGRKFLGWRCRIIGKDILIDAGTTDDQASAHARYQVFVDNHGCARKVTRVFQKPSRTRLALMNIVKAWDAGAS